LLPGESNGFPGGEFGESYKDIVFGVDPEYFFGCHFFSPAPGRSVSTLEKL
jgi:hypothetical protein